MATAQAPPDQADGPQSRTFRAECGGCGRLVRRHSRKALTWRCPHCKRVNAGPGLLEEMARPPAEGRVRRRTRRAAAAELRQGEAQPAAQAGGAPVATVRRRRQPAPPVPPAPVAPAPGEAAAGENAGGAPAPPSDQRPQRGVLARAVDAVLYGGGE